ncbi:DEAD/DEAH box helicase [Shewanella sp. NIFS-20-20]|uniref:DEAD/DEAH box helicase n=1 Tax=Shewanella sp. NIFS-20-20 TaxID=2853806 RepID=UPI001C4699E0|nr:DEAD/DEAH box helicase [Shewanella sp. NIFS-20-20]MBV7314557.1 DEAD/DEAH box helicase [Shewanella sp. NIFS-20-20]
MTVTAIQLRDYQQAAVDAAIAHFRASRDSALMVLPTGAGKSIVIAQLARLAKGRVLVLTHVKELVAQNAEKVGLLTSEAGIYSAGLNSKDTHQKTVVASIQSASRAASAFSQAFSLVIVDECHRISLDENSQYQLFINHLRQINPNIKILGLTATPFRLGHGFIYKHHYHGKVGNLDNSVFDKCIFELPLRPLIKQGYLTSPVVFDAIEAQYNFSNLDRSRDGQFDQVQVANIINASGRATTAIIKQIVSLASSRTGVIIFAATVKHADEILHLLGDEPKAIVTAETDSASRDQIIANFKAQKIKYLVNVSVLTTGFDAPHVDFIAILRPTESVSLYQQMVGRGLRLAPNKTDCLIIDYAANGYSLYAPEIGRPKPDSQSVPVQVHCPACHFANTFWGKTDNDGDIIEHYGRRCQALLDTQQQCQYRFRARICPDCGGENDIAARQCHQCQSVLVDPDNHLKQVLKKQQHHLFKVHEMLLEENANGLTVRYLDLDGNDYCRRFAMQTPAQIRAVYALFIYPHTKTPGIKPPKYNHASEIVNDQFTFRAPDLLLLKKSKKGWDLLQHYFDYQGKYQTHQAKFAS